VELQPSGRGGGVDLLGQRAEADLAVVQILDRFDHVAGTAELKAGVEFGTMAERSGAAIAEYAPAAGLLDRVELQGEVLIVGGDARVADQVPGGRAPPPRGAAACFGGRGRIETGF
jgi:hypothetical protein